MRERENWRQEDLAEKAGMNQNAIYRLENPFYGKFTLTTLKRIAAVFDVALVVRFVPFSQFADWVSGTPFIDSGLSPESFDVTGFGQDSIRDDSGYMPDRWFGSTATEANPSAGEEIPVMPGMALPKRIPTSEYKKIQETAAA